MLYRSETRDRGTRVIDHIDPVADPFAAAVEPDRTTVRQLNRRFAIFAEGEVLFATKDFNAALTDARQRNQAVQTDSYAVNICDIDQAGTDGKLRWQAVRDWLAASGDDLQAPPLAKPRPDDSDEAKTALRAVRQLHPDDAWADGVDVWFFAERVRTTMIDGTLTQSLEIASASRDRLSAVLFAHRKNETGDGSPYHVRAVNIAIDGLIDGRGVVAHGSHREFVRSLNDASR